MKFGKRIRAQCFSEWKEHYLDYNLLKTTLKLSERFFELQEENCEQVFFKALLLELVKVNEFYLVMESKSLEEAKKLERFEDKTSKEPSNGSQDLDNLYEQVEQLRKYVVFNYMAVVKIVKKRNKKLSKFKVRHLQSISFFINQPFYKTAKLAHLHHKLELLKLKFTQTDVSHQRLDFSCSICWELLNGPVLINCGHTFCLVCLESLLNASDSDVFACPNCRKVHLKAETLLKPSHEMETFIKLCFDDDAPSDIRAQSVSKTRGPPRQRLPSLSKANVNTALQLVRSWLSAPKSLHTSVTEVLSTEGLTTPYKKKSSYHWNRWYSTGLPALLINSQYQDYSW